MKTAFIIVLYKTPEKEIDRLRGEIKNLGFKNYEVYFVDNTKKNRGYAGGVNEVLRKTQGNPFGKASTVSSAEPLRAGKVTKKQGNIISNDLFVVMNPDISLKNLNAEDFFNVSKKFDIAGFAFKQSNKTYYGGEIDKWKLSGGLRVNTSMNRFIEVDFVSGSLMIIKKEVIKKIGFFDESYFMYYEDVDFCYRAKKAGFKIGVDTEKSYEHFEVSNKLNLEKDEWLAKSHKKFFEKYGNVWQKAREILRLSGFARSAQNDKKRRSRFFVNFFSLNFSAFLNKFLNFFLFIFLVRYLSPSDYGIYVIVWAFIEFFSPFLDFGTTSYGLTYLPQEKPKIINQLFSLRFFLSIIIFALITPIAWFFFPGQKNLLIYIFLTSIVVLSNMWSGSYLIITSIKEKVYRASIVSVIFNVLLISSLVLVLLTKQHLDKLFLTIGLAYLIYALVNWQLVRREVMGIKLSFDTFDGAEKRRSVSTLSKVEWVDLTAWRPIIKKSFFFVLIGFFSGLYFKQDVFLLKYLQSDQAVGIYSAGYKFLEALVLMAGSYSLAVLPVLAKMTGDKEALKKRINRDFFLIILLGLTVALTFYFTSPFLLPIFLKLKYTASLAVSRIVIFALPLILGTTVCFNTLYILGRVKTVILIYFFQILLNLFLNIILIPKYSFFASAYITVLCEIINLIVGYYFVRKYLFHENRS